VLNKLDLLPYVDFDLARAAHFATRLNRGLAVFEVSCRTGQGLPAWYDWLRMRRAAKKVGQDAP
jgi:hydrogenase nickel incorporation protein HypB